MTTTIHEIEAIESLDFSPALACEIYHDPAGMPYMGEPQKAVALLSVCYPCQGEGSALTCQRCLDHILAYEGNLNCTACIAVHPGPHRQYVISVTPI